MNNFVNDYAEIAWDLFASTGKIGFYMLYSNINYDKERITDYADDNYVHQYNTNNDNGLEM